MKRLPAILAFIMGLTLVARAGAQQAQPQPSETAPRIEAKREVIVNWTLGDQSWNFNDIRTAYEPIKGYLEPRGSQGHLAVWKLKLVKDLEQGAAKFHEETRGSPFKIVLLDAERTIINPDLPAQITPVSGKMDDTIELYVALPEAHILKDVKTVRVQRRTDIGF
jgi:hypothetical protein